jgi:hypothetical protein
MTDLWDAKLTAWILHWDYTQTLRDPLNLFQAPILHPARYVLAFSENLYGAAVFGFPLYAAGFSPIVVYNVVLLVGMLLSGWSAWALARYITGDAGASLVAGIVYGFLPYKLSQIAHFHMQWGPFLPLVFLFLLRYFDEGRRRDAVLFGIALAWSAIACIQYAFFTTFLVAVVFAFELVRGIPDRSRRTRGALLALALSGLAALPFAAPYKKASEIYRMRRTVGEMTFYSAKPGYFLSAGDRNKLWGPLTTRFRGPEGDFFPGLLALSLAVVPVLMLRRSAASPAPGPEVRPWGRRAARALDVTAVVLVAVWLVVRSTPHLKIGPMSLGDAGRVQVLFTVAVFVRLAFAFPLNSRYRNLADFLRRQPLDPRVLLLLLVAAAGVLISLGGNTPYYRFLFLTFGAVFRAIRAASRGVILFQIALAVLAAWGLALMIRRRSAGDRWAAIAIAIGLITVEYRAFPLTMMPYEWAPGSVYQWLRGVKIPGAVVEWPFGFPFDCEYTLLQAEHGQPLVNGYMSYFPPGYVELDVLLRKRPVPEAEALPVMRALGASVLVYHAHEGRGFRAHDYAAAVERGVASGQIELVGSFPHEGAGLDFAYRLARTPAWTADLEPWGTPPPEAARLYVEAAARLRDDVRRLSPPFGHIERPEEGQRVPPGFWCFGWALDDSGIESVRVTADSAGETLAMIGSRFPGLEKVFPGYDEPGNGGFGFPVPALPPGAHTLRVTLVGRDGGATTLELVIRVDPALSPTPRGPGS